MRAFHDLNRVSVRFDETNLVPNAELLPAAALAQRLDLAGLVDRRLHLAAHGANSGAKALTVIGSILAGGDSIDDTAVLRVGAARRRVRPGAGAVDGRGVTAGAQVVERPAARRGQPPAAGPVVGRRARARRTWATR